MKKEGTVYQLFVVHYSNRNKIKVYFIARSMYMYLKLYEGYAVVNGGPL